ncbi:MAG: DUF1080 domain-containing protein [bacterium]|nr:DUF1080 domain-containing protein [bacterium]
MSKLTLVLTLTLLGGAAAYVQDKVTYDDTPLLPGSKFRVHGDRPWPQVITPGEGAAPPSDATVLFDGSDVSAWRGGPWKVEDGYMEVNGKGSITTKEEFGDMQLHLEFACATPATGSSQGRGNSGVFLMGEYEVQILDCYENKTYPDGQTAALYGQSPPMVNACRPPGEWQSYDILFQTPVFEGEKLVRHASITVLHNGVAVHHAKKFIGSTQHKRVATYSAHGPTGPIQLQEHGNPIRFRNIWVRPLAGYDRE